MSDFIKLLPELIEKYGKAPNKEQLLWAQEYLDLAVQDLKASKLLYDAKIFNMTAYHLQQSVEKTAKAYYVVLGLLDYKEIRKTSHDAPELFIRMVELPGVDKFAEFAKEVSGTEVGTDTSAARAVLSTKSKRAEIARLNAEQINGWLSLIPKIREQMAPLYTCMREDYINFYIVTALRLYILSCLTFPHEQCTHYPDCVVKPKEYTDKLGVIESISNVWGETEAAICEIQRFIDSHKRQR